MSIIAVFSGVHGAGEEIAREVADRLQYTLIGDELLEEVERARGVPRATLARAMTGARTLVQQLDA